MKSEWIPEIGYKSFTEAQDEITDYIMAYNTQFRPHQYNGGLTPNESERLYEKNSKTVARYCWPLQLHPKLQQQAETANKYLPVIISSIQLGIELKKMMDTKKQL